MQKSQRMPVKITTIRKNCVLNYPFHLTTAKFTLNQQDFLFIVQTGRSGLKISISAYAQSNNQVFFQQAIYFNNLIYSSAVSSLKIVDMSLPNKKKYVEQIKFFVGYRSGHLVLVHYKSQNSKILANFNYLYQKKENFLKKVKNYFDSQDKYDLWNPNAIKNVEKYTKRIRLSYLVGNSILLLAEFNPQFEENLQFSLKEIQWNTPKGQKNRLFLHFESNNAQISRSQSICLLAFKNTVCSYKYLQNQEQLYVGLSTEQKIHIYNAVSLQITQTIELQYPIRSLNVFNSGKTIYLLILPYDNHFLIFDQQNCKFLKLQGYSSFISHASLQFLGNPKKCIIMAASIDHKVGLYSLQSIRDYWVSIESQKKIKINEKIKGYKCKQLFSLGDYKGHRDNNYEPGFGNYLSLGNLFCLLTYDGQAKILSLTL